MELDLENLLAARPAESASRGRLALGQVIGDWRVEAYLGAGRSSEVYRVMGTRFGGEGALKLLVDETHGLRERFVRERDILRSLAMPSLPRFFVSGDWEGRLYYVMEYLQPLFLPLDRSEIVPFVTQLAAAVDDLHAAGFVHRDLKPANILRRRTGEPVLIDLGLVRRIGETGNDGVGTMGFSAPEQLLRGESTVKADIFSLGKILRAAGGKRLGHRLRAVARKATHEDPDERYATVQNFIRAVYGCRLRLITGLILLSFPVVLSLILCARRVLLISHHESVQPPPVQAIVSPSPQVQPPESRDLSPAEALVQEAEDLFHGRGVPTNRVEAVRLYRLAAAYGHMGAEDSLGLCLLKGWGCEADPAEAVRHFTIAAEQEHPSAMNNLAFCYLNGLGTERDAHKGFIWALTAAELGHAPSQTLVGECYLEGRGVEADRERALIWLRRAARQGNRRAALLIPNL